MLHEFLTANRNELVRRCREKEAQRLDPPRFPEVSEHGVTLFVQQLTEALKREHLDAPMAFARPHFASPPLSIGRAAALHGAELLRMGYSVEHVVRDYGDVCQTVTEMALEQKAPIATGEFRTLNRCLDDAIADAVTAYAHGREAAVKDKSDAARSRLESISEDQQRLIDTALHAFSAVRTGSIGFSGATGTVLMHTLLELRDLAKGIVRPPASELH